MTLPKWATTVTPFSKAVAFFLFVSFPFVGFYLGMKYQALLKVSQYSSPSTQNQSYVFPSITNNQYSDNIITYSSDSAGYKTAHVPLDMFSISIPQRYSVREDNLDYFRYTKDKVGKRCTTYIINMNLDNPNMYQATLAFEPNCGTGRGEIPTSLLKDASTIAENYMNMGNSAIRYKDNSSIYTRSDAQIYTYGLLDKSGKTHSALTFGNGSLKVWMTISTKNSVEVKELMKIADKIVSSIAPE